MSNPRRTAAVVTRPEGPRLTLKTNMVLRKSATFHSPTSPASSPEAAAPFTPSLPRRSMTNLDDVVDAHRRRVALTLGNIDKTLAGLKDGSSSTRKTLRDDSLPVPRAILDHTVMKPEGDMDVRVLRSRTVRRSPRAHQSDSGLGTSIDTSATDKDGDVKSAVRTSAITRSPALSSLSLPGLSHRAFGRIVEHTIKPLLSKPSLEVFRPIVEDCPRKMLDKEILCLRDLEKTLLLTAPERTKVAGLYLDFCLTTIRCIQATVEYLSEREQTRARDLPYTEGYFIDLVDQIRQYAQQLADAKEKGDDETDEMDIDPSDEIKLHGGINVNGRPAELVRVKKNGKAISMATGELIESVEEEEGKGAAHVKRSASEELRDEEEIMRSMARRKKNASPEELAPKRCREPGCNKEFKRPCDLTKHEKTHSRPWKCPVPTCKYHEYGWPTEKEMDRHHNDKHSTAPAMYECYYKPCPYKSKRESNCKQHMEKAHGWTYIRTKTNGKKPGSPHESSSVQQTPNLINMPTPPSTGIATPPDYRYVGIEFPAFPLDAPYSHMDIPQDIQIDYSPVEHTPSTASSDSNNDYSLSNLPNVAPGYTPWEDIYSANHVQLPTPAPIPSAFGAKEISRYPSYSAAEVCQPQPAAHISPIGQGNAMLFTPSSLDEVDEGFDEYQANQSGPDFLLFPATGMAKPTNPYEQAALFGEIPSVAGGYSQPSSQDFIQSLEWTNTYQGYEQH